MADKENAGPAGGCAAGAAGLGPRLTRAAAKRAAEAAAPLAAAGKRRRVALGELPPALANAAVLRDAKPAAPRHGKKRAKPAAGEAEAQARRPFAVLAEVQIEAEPEPEPERCGSSSPPLAAADSSASASPPRGADPHLCGSYASDIYTYLRSLEVEPRHRPRSDYIGSVQADVTANMRAILVDWLVEVAEEYKLVADTLYLAISYIDRFLSANALRRDRLQLLGVASMLIAAKYEEISPPHAEDFCYITDNTYTRQELLQMESDILKLLEFELGNPTIKTFLRRFTRCANEDSKRSILLMEFLGSYLAELSLLDYDCLRFLPSVVAASVMFVARLTIDPNANPWNKKLQKVTGYKVSELKDCILTIHDLQLNRKCSSVMAIRDKYKQHKFKCVSVLLPPVVIPTSYFEDLAE
ncbi:hypothetical protein U9M48_037215 [Paspalum notatum var. saurae]|uniref:Cyclin N-terminal domain-containing protein n=1 Tax=Paspalum notatum var. saurae TaxID=547442 RepID=A0AAQ3XAU3_PASNO